MTADVRLIQDDPPTDRPPRRCPRCGKPPGKGFRSYCSVEHLLLGPER